MGSVTTQSILMLAVRGTVLALGFGNTVLTARLLQPEGRGLYATIMVALTVVALLIGSLGTGVALSAAHDETELSNRTTNASIGVAWTAGLMPLGILLLWHPQADWHQPAMLAFAGTPFFLFTQYVQFACMGRGRLGLFASLYVIQPALLVVLDLVLMVGLRLALSGAMLAWTLSWVGAAFAAVWALLALGWRLRIAELKPWRTRRLITFGAGAGLYNSLTYFSSRSLLLVVQVLLGPAAAGVFSVAVQLAEPLTYMSAALSTAAYSRLAVPSARSRETRSFMLIATITSTLAAAAIMALASVLLVPIFGFEYQLAIFPLPILLLAYVLQSSREILTLWYVHGEKSYLGPIRAAAAAFLVTVAIAVPLVTHLGTVGAACGAIAGSVALMTILLIGLWKRGFALSALLKRDGHLAEAPTALFDQHVSRTP